MQIHMPRQPSGGNWDSDADLHRSATKGLIAGLAAGLAASWVMTQFQTAVSTTAEGEPSGESEPATAQAAEAVSEGVFGHELTEGEKQVASPAVHYAFGALMGGLYGVLAERSPSFSTGAGTGFGTALWLGADEIGVPAAGLSEPPSRVPASTHAYGLASHIVYGLTAEIVRRGVRRML